MTWLWPIYIYTHSSKPTLKEYHNTRTCPLCSLNTSCACWWSLTHYVLVTPYSDIDHIVTLAQVMAWCLMAPSHYLNQCYSLVRFSGIHLSAVSQWMPTFSVMSLEVILLKLLLHLPGAKELKYQDPGHQWVLFQFVLNILGSELELKELIFFATLWYQCIRELVRNIK